MLSYQEHVIASVWLLLVLFGLPEISFWLLGYDLSHLWWLQCKNVISKLWRRIGKEGHQKIPNIASWWRRNENSSSKGVAGSTLDLQKIELRVDGLEYSGVAEFIADMQQMLKSVVQHFGYRHEVIYSIRPGLPFAFCTDIILISRALRYSVPETCPTSQETVSTITPVLFWE